MRNGKYEDGYLDDYAERVAEARYLRAERIKDLKQEVKLLEAHGYILENMLATQIIVEHQNVRDELARSLESLLEAKGYVERDLEDALEDQQQRADRWQ